MSFMEWFVQFIEMIQREMTEPLPFGSWHLISLCCVVAVLAALILLFRRAKDRTMRLIVFLGWIIIVLLEICKQLSLSVIMVDGVPTWDYCWSAFPFQFCSSPLYVLPFVFLLKDCAVRRAFIAFLSTFSLLAGLIVMVYPNTVFSVNTSINIQTMVHHGLQIVLGIYLFVYSHRHMRWRTLLGATTIFLAFFMTAIALNEQVHEYLLKNDLSFTFNMFFISPYYYSDCELPIVTFLRQFFSYRDYLALYAVAFSIGAAIVFSAEKGICRLCSRNRDRDIT